MWAIGLSLAGCGVLGQVVSTFRPVPVARSVAQRSSVAVAAGPQALGLATLQVMGERLAPRVKVDGRSLQGLDLAQVASVRVTVRGHGQPELPPVTGPVVDGAFSVALGGLTPGPRRLVEAVGLDHEGREVPGAVLAALVDVTRGAGSVVLSWASTPLARTLAEVYRLDLAEGRQRLSLLDVDLVRQWIDTALAEAGGLHGAFVDHLALAERLWASDMATLRSQPPQVVLHRPSTLVLGVRGLGAGEELLVRVHDPASLPFAGMDNGAFALGPILPGTWRVWLRAPGRPDKVVGVPFSPGSSVSMEVDLTMAGATGGSFAGPSGSQTPVPVPYPSNFDWSAWQVATPIPVGTLPPGSGATPVPGSSPYPYVTPTPYAPWGPTPFPTPYPGFWSPSPTPTPFAVQPPGEGGVTPTPFAPYSPYPSPTPFAVQPPGEGGATPTPLPTAIPVQPPSPVMTPSPAPSGNSTMTIKVRFDE
ncbi:MAG: hypothetical protein VKO21_01430 [Candidatus Sericytochromatia bacterium]|nr:hypothetical protein [Candidatus Sericytochromatia bacterium]